MKRIAIVVRGNSSGWEEEDCWQARYGIIII